MRGFNLGIEPVQIAEDLRVPLHEVREIGIKMGKLKIEGAPARELRARRILERLAEGATIQDLADEFNLSPQMICTIRRRNVN